MSAISSAGPETAMLAEVGIRHITARRIYTTVRLDVGLEDVVALGRGRFTVVHTHTAKASVLGQLVAWAIPIRIHTMHGYCLRDEMSRPARSLYLFVERLIGLCADAVLSQSREDIATADSKHLYVPGKAVFLGNGINVLRVDREKVRSDSCGRHTASTEPAPFHPCDWIRRQSCG